MQVKNGKHISGSGLAHCNRVLVSGWSRSAMVYTQRTQQGVSSTPEFNAAALFLISTKQ